MRSPPWTAGLLALGVGCSSAPPGEVLFPLQAARIEGVCNGARAGHDGGDPHTPARGLTVSVEAPFANGQRRFHITNGTASPHVVHAESVVAATGRCDQPWTHWSRLGLEDSRTCSRPRATTLSADQSLDLRLQPHRERFEEGCTKIGLALHATVDGEPACVELGSWVVYRPGDD